MKTLIPCLFLCFALVACDNKATIEVHNDSAGRGVDTTLNRMMDSVETKGKRVVETIKEKVDSLHVNIRIPAKDSAQ